MEFISDSLAAAHAAGVFTQRRSAERGIVATVQCRAMDDRPQAFPCPPKSLLFLRFQADTLRLCRWALNVAFAFVTFAADTIDGVGFLGLDGSVSQRDFGEV